MTAARLSRRPLTRRACDGRRRQRVAGRPYTVSAANSATPPSNAALERLAASGSPRPQHDAVSIPARSTRTDRPASPRRPLSCLTPAPAQRQPRCEPARNAAAAGSNRRITSSPSSREQRPPALVAHDLRASAAALCVAHVGRVAQHSVALADAAISRPARIDVRPSRAALRRARPARRHSHRSPPPQRSGRSCFKASAIAPLPVPTSTTLAPTGSERPTSTSSSVSGRGTSTRGSTVSSTCRNARRPTMYATGSRATDRRRTESWKARTAWPTTSRP